MIVPPSEPHAAEPYVLVRSEFNIIEQTSAAPMCRALVKRLNEIKYEPPMTCRRKFDPLYAYFPVPDWKLLGDEEARQAALALARSWARKGAPEKFESRYLQVASEVEKVIAAGTLRAWEAKLDIAKTGERVRVVLVSYGEYKLRDWCFYSTKLGVLLPDKFEVDERYRHLSPYKGELLLYRGNTYIAVWSSVPTGTLSDPVGPRGERREGYLLVQSINAPDVHGPANAHDTVCQIGYGRVIGYQK